MPDRVRVVVVVPAGVFVVRAAEIEQLPQAFTIQSGRRHLATNPPSLGSATPVTLRDAADTRYSAASARDSAVIAQPRAFCCPTSSAICACWAAPTSSPPAARSPVAGIAAGQIAFTRIPKGAASI